MNTNSNAYVMTFAVGICVVMSTALAFLATSLKPTQEAAAEFDRQKNVMMAAGMIERGDPRPRAELEKLFAERVEEVVIDTESGDVVDGKTDEELAELRKQDPKRYRRVGISKTESGAVDTYILPISGKGLWSTLYGYLALESDKNHVRGIQFYKHGETPGLGGEVENPKWTAKWQGKTIRDDEGNLVSITVKKGVVDPAIEREKEHAVDGLAGATITSKGVQSFVKSDLEAFAGYLGKE